MITDREAMDSIYQAILTEDLKDLTADELDKVFEIHWFNDPDIEFVELDYTLEAGPEGHGTNTEDEMMETN